MGKKKGKSAKLIKKAQLAASEDEYQKCPHSFVFNRGHIGKTLAHLLHDMRRVMSPYTASDLKVRKNNVLKDFVSVAGPLHVTHFIIFTKTDTGCYMRIARLPRGPTLTFRIANYSLSSDIVSSLKRHNMEAKQFLHHPLLVMNNFSGEGLQLKLMTTMFQNLFQSINVNKIKLSAIRRCVLLNYNSDTKQIEFRHYNIRAVPVGLSKAVKKIARHTVPDLGKYKDVSEYIMRDGNMSESEAEQDGPHNEVTLPQDLTGVGNVKSSRSAIRLTEIGPRMTLQLIKVQEGLCDGEVLYHEFVTKTPEEIKSLKLSKERKRKVKAERKREQEENVTRKKAKLESLRAESRRNAGLDSDNEATENKDEEADEESEDSEDNEESYQQMKKKKKHVSKQKINQTSPKKAGKVKKTNKSAKLLQRNNKTLDKRPKNKSTVSKKSLNASKIRRFKGKQHR